MPIGFMDDGGGIVGRLKPLEVGCQVQAPADQLAGDETSRRAVNAVNPLLGIEPQIPRLNGIRAQEPETLLCRVAPVHDVHDSAIAMTRRDRYAQLQRRRAAIS